MDVLRTCTAPSLDLAGIDRRARRRASGGADGSGTRNAPGAGFLLMRLRTRRTRGSIACGATPGGGGARGGRLLRRLGDRENLVNRTRDGSGRAAGVPHLVLLVFSWEILGGYLKRDAGYAGR